MRDLCAGNSATTYKRIAVANLRPLIFMHGIWNNISPCHAGLLIGFEQAHFDNGRNSRKAKICVAGTFAINHTAPVDAEFRVVITTSSGTGENGE